MPTHFWQGHWRGKAPAGDTHVRARKIIRPTGGIVRGKFPSRKNGRMVHYEGLLELHAIYLFETSPRIVQYREQPLRLRYPDGDRLRRYTPDFELVLKSGEIVLVEVKPRRSLSDEAVQHTLKRITDFLRRSSHSFAVLDDLVIRQEPRLSNLQWIYHRASRVPPTHSAALNAIRQCGFEFPMSVRDLSTRFSAIGMDPFSLLLAGWLTCSLDESVNSETFLKLTKETDHDWFWIAKKYGF